LPTYEYRCISCEHQFERFQRMSEDPVKQCEVCGEPVERVLFPVAIHYKGNGFYNTDYGRRTGLSTSGTRTTNANGSDSSSDAESTSSTDTAKPAASEAGSSTPVAAATKND
jgi:putative FmdB family regulatory protein